MYKKLSQKIRKAVKKGDLIPYERVLHSYSRKERKEIAERVRYIKVAMELRKLRKKLDLSQGALAKKISVKREYISRIESGKQNVTLDTLYRIAEATGKEVEVMLR